MTIDPVGMFAVVGFIYLLHEKNDFKHDPIGAEQSMHGRVIMQIKLFQNSGMLQIVAKQ